MNTKQLALSAAIAIGLGACNSEPASQFPAEPPLAGASIGGPFSLVNSKGETVTNDSLKGDWRLVYFGYTFCPDVCPVDVERMARAYANVKTGQPELAEDLTPVFITVDPARDTEEVVGEFAAAFSPDMIGLTGSDEAVAEAVNAYRVYATLGEPRDDGFYLVDHSAYIYLMDPDGQPVNSYDRATPPEAIAADIEHWMTS
ncbi:MAG: SCO family protein [Pacificimonas sp.]